MRGLVLSALMTLVTLSSSAGDNGWKCEWFGIGCPDGELNQVLMDLGRESTNTGFLFFEGDTAVIERTLELTFSKRSIAKQDKLYIQVASEGLPEGATVTLDGTSCLEPDDVAFVARTQQERVVLRWTIPPSGEDVDLAGTVQIRPYGFDRAGSLAIRGKEGRAIQMLRIQGEVDNDWHWSKRLTFWFWATVLSLIILIKWGLGPIVYPRFKFRYADVTLTEEELGEVKVLFEGRLKMRRKRLFYIGSEYDKPGAISCWLWGRVGAKEQEGLAKGGIVLRSGGKSRYHSKRPSGNMVRVIGLDGAALSHVYQFNGKKKVRLGISPTQFIEFKEIK